MTSRSSITNKDRAGFMPLFNFTAKQFWTTILLFTIILFFVLPVPILMIVSERTIDSTDDFIRLQRDIAEEWTDAIRYVVVILMSIFGVVVSCSRFKYLKNKVSIDFYHSLPVKRGQLFLTQLGVSALSLAIPYVFNILFTLIVIASNGLISTTLIINVLILSAETLVYTVFFYALSTLVGMISGLTAVQLTLTIVAIFIIPAVYITMLAFVNIFNENMWFSFYANPDLFEKLSPALRFVFDPEPLYVIEAVVLLLISALIFAASYLIYMHRKSERAGTPVVFAPLGEVIKYVLVFLGTMLGGLLFYYIMDSFVWTVFGMICGMVLVFMLVNTILNKTARAMFKGWKGLCIFGVAAAIAFTMLMTNAFGINSNVPSPKNTSRVAVNFQDGLDGMEFRDKEVIEAIHTIYTEGHWAYTGGYNKNYWNDSVYLEIVFYPHFGIPTAKTVRIYDKSNLIDEFRTILDSEEFKKQYVNALGFLEDNEGYMMLNLSQYYIDDNGLIVNQSTKSKHWNIRKDEFSLSSITGKQLGLDILTEENKACGFDFFQQPSIGYIYAYANDYYDSTTIFLPITASMTALTNHYVETGYIRYTPEEYLERLAGVIGKIEVRKINDDGNEKNMTVTDKGQILEILSSTASPYGGFQSDFTFVESDYYITYTLDVMHRNDVVYYYDEHGNEFVETVPSDEVTTRSYTEPHELAFLLGQVPDFIVELLG